MPKRGERGRTLRSSHLGYDLYVTGQEGQSTGRVRIIQRPTRLPPNISTELRAMLPVEMWWPQRDVQQGMACVDACLVMDGNQLKRWKDQFPEHVFGYERYIDWLDRLKAAQGGSISSRGEGGPGKLTPLQLSHFPSQVVDILPFQVLNEEAHVVKIAVLKFQDHTSALRFTIYGKLVVGSPNTDQKALQKLSRAYVDPVSGEYDIIEHYPGRYKALELPESLLHQVLGIRHFKMHRREGTMKRRAEVASDLRGMHEGTDRGGVSRNGSEAHGALINHANATMGDSVRVQVAAFGDRGMRRPSPRQRRKTLVEGSGPGSQSEPVEARPVRDTVP